MPNTAHGLPYPDANAYVIDGAGAIQDLAEDVDAELFRSRVRGHVEAEAFYAFSTLAWQTIADTAVAFVAPKSGVVTFDIRADTHINDTKNDAQARIGFDLAGPTALAPADARSINFKIYNNAGGSGLRRLPFVSWKFVATGLTPGGAYTVTFAYRGDGVGQWYPYARQIFVEG